MCLDLESLSPFSQTTGNMTNSMNANGAHVPPSEDRYAALKDLDSLMKQIQLKDDTATTLNTSTWNTNNGICIYICKLPKSSNADKQRDIYIYISLNL